MRRTLAGLLVAAALTTSACGDPATDPSAAAPPSSPAAVPTTDAATPDPSTPSPTAAQVPEKLRFTVKTVDGKTFDGASLAGKPAVFWFWAAWCPRCRAAADDIAAIQRDFDGRVQVVGVAGLSSGDAAMGRFVSDTGISAFPNLADDAGTIWKHFGVRTQEYYVLLDASGKVVHSGALTPSALRDKVAALAG